VQGALELKEGGCVMATASKHCPAELVKLTGA